MDNGVEQVRLLIAEGYVPFANIERAIPWPNSEHRLENDAEHSHSLAFIGVALGAELNLDTGKIAKYATFHDFVERYAGDTSVWDQAATLTKLDREAEALTSIEDVFRDTPAVASIIHDYEALIDEEARFVYALDKLVAFLMIIDEGGRFWKDNHVTFDAHVEKSTVVRPKVAKHPVVLTWYDEALKIAEVRKDDLFWVENS